MKVLSLSICAAAIAASLIGAPAAEAKPFRQTLSGVTQKSGAAALVARNCRSVVIPVLANGEPTGRTQTRVVCGR
jgi:hypothetical protein